MNFISDYKERGLDRLLEQYRGSFNLNMLLTAYLESIQQLEDSTHDVYKYTKLENAYGYALDLIGENYNVARQERKDAEYREALQIQILINNSNGTIDSILTAIKVLFKPKLIYIKEFKCYLQIHIKEPIQLDRIFEILQIVITSGVKYSIIYEDTNTGVLARLSSATTNINANTNIGRFQLRSNDNAFKIRSIIAVIPPNAFRLSLRANLKQILQVTGGTYFVNNLPFEVTKYKDNFLVLKGSSFAIRLTS